MVAEASGAGGHSHASDVAPWRSGRGNKDTPRPADEEVVRLIPSRKIRDGVELARDVVNGPPGTAPLLRAGAKLSARYATLLPTAGVGSVWIHDELGEAMEVAEPLTAETRAKVH